MKIAKILCWFGRHDYRKRMRPRPPAMHREEMRCTRCDDNYLIPERKPRYRKVFGEPKAET